MKNSSLISAIENRKLDYTQHTIKSLAKAFKTSEKEVGKILRKRLNRFLTRKISLTENIHLKIEQNRLYKCFVKKPF